MTSDCGCILIVCGLPASGKSSLIHQIETGLMQEFRIIVVEYDHLMPGDVEKMLITETSAEEASKWKLYREEIVECVDILLGNLSGLSSVSPKTCSVASQPVSVSDGLWMKFEECYTSILGNEVPSGASRPFVIIIDDNMYYRSMRYQYFQLARKHRVGFSELYLDCSTETAVSQNAMRVAGQVDENVIRSMATHFESPNKETCQWEKHSLQMSSHSAIIGDIRLLINSAIEDPVHPLLVEDVEQKEESRQICSQSGIHQADQILRKLIAQQMIAAKASGTSTDKLKQMAGQLAEKRSRILKDMKLGIVTLNLTTDVKNASKDPNSQLYKFIASVFC
ncbi:L-seryl-tRNA(Sec) kinase-like [Gigantopelta aegis]|uniref:L-seryl-tRNA(Sec) kinase-like n=1 Tax=Gigantopelta aegis TaxID=1735272 RepID=UPI001B888111|nr:L-seryl-tRNA(Sec) kinase-like [Gigantopelta aegis]